MLLSLSLCPAQLYMRSTVYTCPLSLTNAKVLIGKSCHVLGSHLSDAAKTPRRRDPYLNGWGYGQTHTLLHIVLAYLFVNVREENKKKSLW